MTKFNVGDKVRFIEKFGEYSKGDEVTIKSFIDTDYVEFEGEHGVGDAYTRRLELVKTTKNQRITALEKTVAKQSEEISELKLIIHELRGKKSIEPSTIFTAEDKPLTPNQQRAAIIEKAKKFVEGNLKLLISYDFVVINNGTKLYSRQLFQDIKLTTAKCSPNDVFNEHIGKAIALGRALGLDVSEFEQAVQPNEVVSGHIIAWDEVPNEPHKVIKRNGDWFDFTNLFNNKDYNNFEYCEIEEFTTILNDTNAKYEVES